VFPLKGEKPRAKTIIPCQAQMPPATPFAHAQKHSRKGDFMSIKIFNFARSFL